jgi:hypothetical protein
VTRSNQRLLFLLPIALLMLMMTVQAATQIYAILLPPSARPVLMPRDPDSWRRLAQARQWIAEGDIHDREVRRTNAPFGGIETHWTRPMDALLAGAAGIMPKSFSLDTRLLLGAAWLPGTMGVMAFALLAMAARRHLRHAMVTSCVAMMGIAMLVAHPNFTAGNADHHSLQCLLWCLCLWLLQKEKAVWAMALGSALGLSVWISPEGFVPISLAYAILGAAALGTPGRYPFFMVTAIACAATAAAGLAIEFTPEQIHAARNMLTISAPHVFLLTAIATAGLAVMPFFMRAHTLKTRIILGSVAATAALGVSVFIFPVLLQGPFGTPSPFVRDVFYPGIEEMQPLFGSRIVLAAVMTGMAGMAGALLYVRRVKTPEMQAAAFLLVATYAMTCLHVRLSYYLMPVAVTVISALLPALARQAKPSALSWLRALPPDARPLLLLLLYVFFIFATPSPPGDGVRENMRCNAEISRTAQNGEMEMLLGNPPLTIFAPLTEGPRILFFTPYSIIASNYDYEENGLKDFMKIWNTVDVQDALPVLRHRNIGALIVCPEQYTAPLWLAGIATKENLPPWLYRVGRLGEGADAAVVLRVRK